jgi:septum formation protein
MIGERLILASGSPRRRQLLAEAGFTFDVVVPDPGLEHGIRSDLSPAELVVHAALVKAQAVAAEIDRGIVMAADTVAVCDDRILGKPGDREDARQMLAALSGKRHHALTGVCLWHRPSNHRRTFLERTELEMDSLSPDQIERYLDSGEWAGKAGAFGYQDRLDWIHVIAGSENNVVGLPVERLAAWLNDLVNSLAGSTGKAIPPAEPY